MAVGATQQLDVEVVFVPTDGEIDADGADMAFEFPDEKQTGAVRLQVEAGTVKGGPVAEWIRDPSGEGGGEVAVHLRLADFHDRRPFDGCLTHHVENVICLHVVGRRGDGQGCGAMPYAQWHYPFENQDVFKQNFPADFIAEGVDQTRGWFFTLHAISTLLFDEVAFKNVIANGLVLDKNGNKMSKRLGNAIDPFETVAKYGADAVRWYMVTNAQPWDNLKFDMDGVVESQRKFLGTLYNTYGFFAIYANLDQYNFNANDTVDPVHFSEMDRWILSKLNSLILEVETALHDYDPTRAGRAIEDFVGEQLSNWYVRLSRRRFWKGELNNDKKEDFREFSIFSLKYS